MELMNEFSPRPNTYRYHDISEGMKHDHDYVISDGVYETFLTTFHDLSPIHVDEAYAKSKGFDGKVMHGALLNCFLSHFIGMHFPGRLSLLLSADLRYARPSYLGDVIRLQAVVTQKMEAQQVVILDATFSNKTRDYLAARGRIQVMLREDKA